MHVISRKKIQDAKSRHQEAISALEGFYRIIAKNEFSNFADLKRVFGSVDKIDDKYVFDIGGNKLRLIASIHFDWKKFYIRKILTHAEYDKGGWKK